MKSKNILNIAILVIALAAISFGIYSNLKKKPLRYLPYYGHRDFDKQTGDTIFHTIANFSFIDQQNNKVTPDNFKEKIYVADYFFCTCQSICPKMSEQMDRLAQHFAADNEIKFISHTVNPEYDSVNVLADYAKLHHAKYGQWYLVTGDKKELYDIARTSYLLDASEGDGGEDDFIHTENFALIDKEKHIRGYYDGTNPKEIDQLINDIVLLKKEYQFKNQ